MANSSDIIHILESKSKLTKKWVDWTNEELMTRYFGDEEVRKNKLKTRVDSLYVRVLIKQQIVNKLQILIHDENLRVEMGKSGREFVEKNFDDVGCDFAKEALKIHYGATEPRNIRVNRR